MLKNYLFLALLIVSCLQIADCQTVGHPQDGYNQINPQQEKLTLTEPTIFEAATITSPPKDAVRPMAEWEEIEAITITWESYARTLSQIVKHAQHECKVYINCKSAEQVKSDLAFNEVEYNENVIFFEDQEFNSVWIRDYGPNSAYLNDVDSLIFVDWVYNRAHRPEDDILPEEFANQLNVPLFQTVEGEFQLTATGGNFMSDGIGNGFSSKLVVFENLDKTEVEIDDVMHDFLGIDNYVKFDTLAYDGIHHIDMHMKLLDEERFIFGQFPEGVADHDVIEANIEYLLSTQLNAFGEPYEIIRIPMPPGFDDSFPDDPNPKADKVFRTYTNALFINKTILVPTYEAEHDVNALKIWRETMPGYNIVGIKCNEMIDAFGAIHCVTKEIGVKDPLRIVMQRIKDQDTPNQDGYALQAKIQHRSGVAGAILYYRHGGTSEYQYVVMDLIDPDADMYEATIPNFIDRGEVEYYIQGIANNGKTINRPQPAPEGYYSFEINNQVTSTLNLEDVFSEAAFPNPSSGLVCIPIDVRASMNGDLSLFDVHGKLIKLVYEGRFEAGSSKQFVNVSDIPSGLYSLKLTNQVGVYSQKLVVE